MDKTNKKLWKNYVTLDNINYLTIKPLEKLNHLTIQLRYHSHEIEINKISLQGKLLMIEMAQVAFGVAPGQIGVIYDGHVVVASGVIT
jgi:tRNA U34 2-thiouridine synthase MnmA/TrmU